MFVPRSLSGKTDRIMQRAGRRNSFCQAYRCMRLTLGRSSILHSAVSEARLSFVNFVERLCERRAWCDRLKTGSTLILMLINGFEQYKSSVVMSIFSALVFQIPSDRCTRVICRGATLLHMTDYAIPKTPRLTPVNPKGVLFACREDRRKRSHPKRAKSAAHRSWA